MYERDNYLQLLKVNDKKDSQRLQHFFPIQVPLKFIFALGLYFECVSEGDKEGLVQYYISCTQMFIGDRFRAWHTKALNYR